MSFKLESDHLEKCYKRYDDVLRERASKLTKTPRRPKGGDTLIELDNWYQHELPKLICERPEKHITHEELSKLMVWKLMRGKFRPRLTELVKENKPEDVISASKKAFQCLPNLSKAISALTVLKAVGPATASGVLAAGAPDHAPFMADESMLVFPELTPLDYSPKHYLRYADMVNDRIKEFKGEGVLDWTPHKMELALWAAYEADRLGMDIETSTSANGGESRKRSAEPSKSESKKTKKK